MSKDITVCDHYIRIIESFNEIAELYYDAFADKLSRKPFDQDFFYRVAARLPAAHLVLEVGAGPAQISKYFLALSFPVVASDAALHQLKITRKHHPNLALIAADFRSLPFHSGSLGAIIAYYSLLYAPADQLDKVFREWNRALCIGGLAVIAVHAGTGTLRTTEWQGKKVDIEIVLREPDDLKERFRANNFEIDECVVREPYPDEVSTNRCYIVARRT